MNRKLGLLSALLLAGCATQPQVTPWRADPLPPAFPDNCPASTATAAPALPLVPGGLTVVNSGGRDVVIVAARSCVMVVDAASGSAEALPTHGDAIAPTAADATSLGLAFTSSLSGSVRAIDATGAITFNFSGLRRPLGLELMPGGAVLVAEYDAGRIVQVGPREESRLRLLAEKLDGPVDLVVTSATTGYVTETLAGRVTFFRLDRFVTSTVTGGLRNPQGIALMSNGRLAVVEAGLRRLVAVDPTTGQIEVLAEDLPIGPPAQPDVLGDLADVAVAPDGTLFISSSSMRGLLKVTPRFASATPAKR
jgi:glucose/arabinose dehydrogenase